MLFASCDLVLVVTALAAATEAYVIDSTRAASLTVDKGLDLFSRALPIGTCDPNTPCPNGACCGNNGLCGYSPLECGTGCHSNCDAKAECGQYGTPGSNTCPLDVCCSQFG
jgi:chitinase